MREGPVFDRYSSSKITVCAANLLLVRSMLHVKRRTYNLDNDKRKPENIDKTITMMPIKKRTMVRSMEERKSMIKYL